MKTPLLKSFSLAAMAALATTQLAHAAGLFGGQEMDSLSRAKVMKEKVKLDNKKANNFDFTNDGDASSEAQCGSQNIGNVDTGGKKGAAPREVFVFAPNAININSSQSCK